MYGRGMVEVFEVSSSRKKKKRKSLNQAVEKLGGATHSFI